LRARGASGAHSGCSDALGGYGERLEWPGHVRATVAVGRRRWTREQAVRRLGCENGELKWSTRCARMRRIYWCGLHGRRRLDDGNGERRSCGGSGGENREEENVLTELVVFVGSRRGYSAGKLASSR
jgi:hypothetical protein